MSERSRKEVRLQKNEGSEGKKKEGKNQQTRNIFRYLYTTVPATKQDLTQGLFFLVGIRRRRCRARAETRALLVSTGQRLVILRAVLETYEKVLETYEKGLIH